MDSEYVIYDLSQVDLSAISSDSILSLLDEPSFLPHEAAASLSPLLSSPTLGTDENFNIDMFVGSTSDQSSPEMSPSHDESVKSSPTPASVTETTTTKTKKNRTKKRQRKDEEESTDVSAVTLTRDQLLHFSSNELDMFARNLATTRSLTSAEEKELKRQRRLIKNRESAQASRERKRVFVDEMQDQINALKNENAKLLQAMEALRSENSSLREELSLFYKQASGKSHENDNKISFGDLLSIKKPTTDNSLSNKIKTAGVTLLIILFSFGLFFNNLGENRQISLPAHLKSVREQIPTVLHGSVHQPLEKLGRQMKEFSAPNSPNTESLRSPAIHMTSGSSQNIPVSSQQSTSRTPMDYTTSSSASSFEVPKTTVSVMNELNLIKRTDSSPIVQRNYNDSTHSISYRKVGTDHLFRKRSGSIGKNEVEDSTESVGSLFMSEFANESTPTNSTSQLSPDAALSKWFNEHIDPQANTAYLACSDVQQIIPPTTQTFDPKSPFYVSFLIPSQQTVADDNNVTLMMEITALVTDIGVSQFSPASPNRQSIQIPVM